MDGIILTPLKHIYNPKGDIFHALKKIDDGYNGFGEAYFSTVNKGNIKGWKKHNEMILNLVVIIGNIEFVIYNEHLNKFFSVQLSQKNYKRLTVKPGLWIAFRGINKKNILLNIASILHDPSESESMNLDKLSYTWEKI